MKGEDISLTLREWARIPTQKQQRLAIFTPQILSTFIGKLGLTFLFAPQAVSVEQRTQVLLDYPLDTLSAHLEHLKAAQRSLGSQLSSLREQLVQFQGALNEDQTKERDALLQHFAVSFAHFNLYTHIFCFGWTLLHVVFCPRQKLKSWTSPKWAAGVSKWSKVFKLVVCHLRVRAPSWRQAMLVKLTSSLPPYLAVAGGRSC